MLTVSLSLSSARAREGTNVILNSTVQSIDQPDYAQSRKFPDDKGYIKRIQIYDQIGLDGKVQRIHSDSDEEDKPGIRAYGLPKKYLQDNGVIERLHFGEDHTDNLKSGRLVRNIFN